MGVPIIPLIKALGPYVTAIATSAIPAFTSKSDSKSDPLVAQQIRELQDAATKNAKELHALAEHLQKVIASAEEAAAEARRRISTYRAMVVGSLALSVLSLATAAIAIAG